MLFSITTDNVQSGCHKKHIGMQALLVRKTDEIMLTLAHFAHVLRAKVSGVALHIYNNCFFGWQSPALWPFLKHAKHNRFSRTYDLLLSMLISSFDQVSSTDTLHGPFFTTHVPTVPAKSWLAKEKAGTLQMYRFSMAAFGFALAILLVSGSDLSRWILWQLAFIAKTSVKVLVPKIVVSTSQRVDCELERTDKAIQEAAEALRLRQEDEDALRIRLNSLRAKEVRTLCSLMKVTIGNAGKSALIERLIVYSDIGLLMSGEYNPELALDTLSYSTPEMQQSREKLPAFWAVAETKRTKELASLKKLAYMDILSTSQSDDQRQSPTVR